MRETRHARIHAYTLPIHRRRVARHLRHHEFLLAQQANIVRRKLLPFVSCSPEARLPEEEDNSPINHCLSFSHQNCTSKRSHRESSSDFSLDLSVPVISRPRRVQSRITRKRDGTATLDFVITPRCSPKRVEFASRTLRNARALEFTSQSSCNRAESWTD